MNYKQHLVGGIALGIGILYASNKLTLDISSLSLLGSVAIGSLLPDIDHPGSFIGNKIPLIPKFLYTTVGHRTLTHSLLFLAIVSMLCSTINVYLGKGIFIGILSHIFLDMLTPQGVSYLYPFKKRRIKWF